MEPGALSVIYRLLVFSPRSVDDLEAGLQVVDFSFIYYQSTLGKFYRRSNHFQYPMTQTGLSFGILVIVICLLFVNCDLEFFTKTKKFL
jgi:hypothetical protein